MNSNYPPIITLTVNVLKSQIKRYRLADWIERGKKIKQVNELKKHMLLAKMPAEWD